MEGALVAEIVWGLLFIALVLAALAWSTRKRILSSSEAWATAMARRHERNEALAVIVRCQRQLVEAGVDSDTEYATLEQRLSTVLAHLELLSTEIERFRSREALLTARLSVYEPDVAKEG